MIDGIIEKLSGKLKGVSCIIGKKEQYINAAVLIPLIKINDELHVLYQVRSNHIRQGGEISFPGGMQESVDHGDYSVTAIRETSEELGIEEGCIELLGQLGTLVSHSGITIDVFVGSVNIKDLSELNLSEEVAEIFTVPLTELLDMTAEIHYVRMEMQPSFIDENGEKVVLLPSKSLGLPKKYDKPWGSRKRKIYFYRYKEHIIWGMTGEMTYTFLKLFEDDL